MNGKNAAGIEVDSEVRKIFEACRKGNHLGRLKLIESNRRRRRRENKNR